MAWGDRRACVRSNVLPLPAQTFARVAAFLCSGQGKYEMVDNLYGTLC